MRWTRSLCCDGRRANGRENGFFVVKSRFFGLVLVVALAVSVAPCRNIRSCAEVLRQVSGDIRFFGLIFSAIV